MAPVEIGTIPAPPRLARVASVADSGFPSPLASGKSAMVVVSWLQDQAVGKPWSPLQLGVRAKQVAVPWGKDGAGVSATTLRGRPELSPRTGSLRAPTRLVLQVQRSAGSPAAAIQTPRLRACIASIPVWEIQSSKSSKLSPKATPGAQLGAVGAGRSGTGGGSPSGVGAGMIAGGVGAGVVGSTGWLVHPARSSTATAPP